MFVQLIQGKVSSREDLERQIHRWDADLRPGAVGFLGTTAGVTADGMAFLAARFASEEQARANSARSEQGAWWTETEKCFSGPVAFIDSSDVQVVIEPTDDAGFVQVITSTVSDRARLEALNERVSSELATSRPDVIGAVTVWDGDRAIDITYFSSEAEAREGEKKELPAEHKAIFEEWQSLLSDVTYLDLSSPLLL
ncbi:MAG TPA: hypothetical protein VM097_06095 [Mycobacteriales bacterium]|nr:hypothetical protein [Mycobacteriales bacterium]